MSLASRELLSGWERSPYPQDCVLDAAAAIVTGDEVGYVMARTALSDQLAPLNYQEEGYPKVHMDVSLDRIGSPWSDMLDLLFKQGVSTLLPRETGRIVDVFTTAVEDKLLANTTSDPKAVGSELLTGWFARTYQIKCTAINEKYPGQRGINRDNLQALMLGVNHYRAQRQAPVVLAPGIWSKRQTRQYAARLKSRYEA